MVEKEENSDEAVEKYFLDCFGQKKAIATQIRKAVGCDKQNHKQKNNIENIDKKSPRKKNREVGRVLAENSDHETEEKNACH